MSIKNVVIGIAIMILTISVVIYGINTFYSEPEYDDYCEENIDDKGESVPGGKCDLGEYNNAKENYSRNIFLITIPLGVIIIAVGALVFGLEAVGAGLMGGGVGTILYGVGGFWRFADDWLKFLLSLTGLLVLILVAYYFNKKFGKK